LKVIINAISAQEGGILTYTKNLAENLARYKEHKFEFWVPQDFPQGELDNIYWETSSATNYNPLQRFICDQLILKQYFEKSDANVLFSSANFGLLNVTIPQILLLREPGLFDFNYLSKIQPKHNRLKRINYKIRRYLMLLSARYATQVMFPSATMRDMVLQWLPDIENKSVVNHYGTPLALFTPAEQEFEKMSVPLRLLFVSVYYPHKNPGVIADAIRILIQKKLPIQARVTMDLDEIKVFRNCFPDYEKLTAPDIKEHLTLGRVPYNDLPDIYRSNDIFVFPSITESFGHPMVEAMASGLPIIAADTQINREICGNAALYFRPFDAENLAEEIMELHQRTELANILRHNSLKRAGKFSWDSHVERLMEIVLKLAGH